MRPLSPGREIAPGTRVLAHLHRSNGLDVYDAYNEPRASRVIAKTLRPDHLRREGAVAALLREGRLLRRLTHPHLVRAFEVYTEPRPVVVMETLTGETLEHMIDTSRRGLGTAELANLGAHLASALTYLHGERVLHLDLKPSNVVAERGRALVIDLSHARAPGRVKAGHGTWCFMAPEQQRGGEVGPAADVWGLGIVLHAAATRRYALMERGSDAPQLEGRVSELRRSRPRLPRELTGLVDAALEPEPGDRPRMAEALRTFEVLA